VKATDAAQIVTEHLQGGRPVEALRYTAPPGDNKLPEK
jgi:(2Fe-2S) ferredoxin